VQSGFPVHWVNLGAVRMFCRAVPHERAGVGVAHDHFA